MKNQVALAVAASALASSVAAFPQLATKLTLSKRQDAHAWAAPGAGDARAACPGLSTLANHGFINRNGRGISLQQMQQGFLDAFGFDFAVTQAGGNNALALQGNGATTFDLDTLNQPHAIEHDASLTREDAQMAYDQNADNHDFNATIWGMSLDLIGPGPHYDAASANTARLGRVEQARNQDFPGWFVENAAGSLAEHGFILTCMNDPTVGTPDHLQARLDWIDYWFTNQRLPTDLGWVKPSAISDDLFNNAVAAVSNAPTTSPLPRSTTSPTGPTTTGPTTTGPTTGGPTTASFSSMLYPQQNTTSTTPSTKTPGGPYLPSGPTSVSVPPQVSSSASSVATSLAGPAPTPPCAYTQELSTDQWNQIKGSISAYIVYVETIVVGLCGAQGVGAMPMPGSSGSGPAAPGGGVGGGAPWYGSSPASPASPAPPAGTCACK